MFRCGYLIVIGDSFTPSINSFFGLNIERNIYIFIIALVTILPISFIPDMAFLSYTSLFSILAEILLVIVVVYHAPQASKQQNAQGELLLGRTTVFSGVGTIAFAYLCQHSSFIVFNTLKTPNKESWRKVAKYSLIATGIISLTLSIGAFICFLNQTEPDILKSFHENQIFIDFARILLGITMVFTYPMENFVFRHCFTELGSRYFNVTTVTNRYLFTLSTVLCWIFSLLIALNFENLGLIFELIGSISGVSLGFIIPSLCYFKTKKYYKVEEFESNMFYYGNVIMFWFGLSVMIIGTIQALTK